MNFYILNVYLHVSVRGEEEEWEGERKRGREGKKHRKTWGAHVDVWIKLVEVQSFSPPCVVVWLKPKSSDLILSKYIYPL